MRTTRSLSLAAAVTMLTLGGGQAALAAPLWGGSPAAVAGRDTAAQPDRGPEATAARMVEAWVRGDRAAARNLAASDQVVDALFAAPAPDRPRPLKCQTTPRGTVCTHGVSGHAKLNTRSAAPAPSDTVTLQVEPGGRDGYQVTAVHFAG